jgi:hypothetical protein
LRGILTICISASNVAVPRVHFLVGFLRTEFAIYGRPLLVRLALAGLALGSVHQGHPLQANRVLDAAPGYPFIMRLWGGEMRIMSPTRTAIPGRCSFGAISSASPVLPRRSPPTLIGSIVIMTAIMGIMSPTAQPFPVVQLGRDFVGF